MGPSRRSRSWRSRTKGLGIGERQLHRTPPRGDLLHTHTPSPGESKGRLCSLRSPSPSPFIRQPHPLNKETRALCAVNPATGPSVPPGVGWGKTTFRRRVFPARKKPQQRRQSTPLAQAKEEPLLLSRLSHGSLLRARGVGAPTGGGEAGGGDGRGSKGRLQPGSRPCDLPSPLTAHPPSSPDKAGNSRRVGGGLEGRRGTAPRLLLPTSHLNPASAG